MTHRSRTTGVIVGTGERATVPAELRDFLVACRGAQRLDRHLSVLDDEFLFGDERELDVLDHLIVADNRLANDYAALAAVRRWLFTGGRLWVMLDRVDPIVLELILGTNSPAKLSTASD